MTDNFLTHDLNDTMSIARWKMDTSLAAVLTNFLSPRKPMSPVTGQTWIEEWSLKIRIYDGTQWVHVGNLSEAFGHLPLNGREAMEANLPAGSNKIIRILKGAAAKDGVTKKQVDDSVTKIEVGTYTGTGLAHAESLIDNTIDISYILIFRHSTIGSFVPVMKADDFPENASRNFLGTWNATGKIQSLVTVGQFGVGTHVDVNDSGGGYAYIVVD